MFEFDSIQELFTPELYWKNPYNMLRLPINASPRDIRRRGDDVEAARFDGTLASAMSCLVPRDFVFSDEVVKDLFEDLKDAPKRFFYMFFWLWPIAGMEAKDDEYIDAMISGTPDGRVKALTYWSNLANGDGVESAIAKHNLAIVYHLIALLYEQFYTDESTSVTEEDCDRYWNGCIKYWDSIADDDVFWDFLTDYIRDLKDPQLTTGMVRRFRHDFPLGFDQINAELLKRYVERNAEEDVKRHLRYMNSSQSELDDVSESLECAVQAVLRKAQSFSDKTYESVEADPHSALQKSREVISTARKLLAVARILEEDTSLNVGKIADDLALLILHCQVVYAKETQEWESCIAILETAWTIAQGDKAKTKIRENIDIVKGNAEYDLVESFYDDVGLEIMNANDDVDARPELGFARAELIVQRSEELLVKAKVLSKKVPVDSFDPSAFADRLALTILGCLVSFANSTKLWKQTLPLLGKAGELARSAKAVARINENIKIVKDNIDQEIVEHFYSAPNLDNVYEQIETDPASGLGKAIELLNVVSQKIQEAQSLQNLVNPEKYANNLAALVLACLIAYGNETNNWMPCVEQLKRVEKIATDAGLLDRIRKNSEIATKNAAEQKLRETCWFCKQNKAAPARSFKIQMAGDVQWENLPKGQRRKKWRVIDVTVPRCPKCADNHDGRIAKLRELIKSCENEIQQLKDGFIVFGRAEKIEKVSRQKSALQDRLYEITQLKDFPDVKELLKKGFCFGDKPLERDEHFYVMSMRPIEDEPRFDLRSRWR